MAEVASQVNIEKALAIGGWMSEPELTWLATQALDRNFIVEFGSLHGRSTRALADHCSGKVWAVDPWAGDYIAECGDTINNISTYVMPFFLENLKDHIVSGRVIPVRGFSYSFKLPIKVDMVFIDGDHRYQTVVRDIKKAYELLNRGGLICGHDYGHPGWPGVKQAVDELVEKVYQVKDTTIWLGLKY